MASLFMQIFYHTDYAADQLPSSAVYMPTNGLIHELHYPMLTAEEMTFEGWYTTPTYDEGTKISIGDTLEVVESNANWYAKWSANTVASLLTNLADELRDLTNTTDKMGLSVMAGHVSDANDEVDSQDALVEQLIQAMQGKSVPPTVEVATCNVTVRLGLGKNGGTFSESRTTVIENGAGKLSRASKNLKSENAYWDDELMVHTHTGVVCGSVVYVDTNGYTGLSPTVSEGVVALDATGPYAFLIDLDASGNLDIYL